jgi:hypothetical protein
MNGGRDGGVEFGFVRLRPASWLSGISCRRAGKRSAGCAGLGLVLPWGAYPIPWVAWSLRLRI